MATPGIRDRVAYIRRCLALLTSQFRNRITDAVAELLCVKPRPVEVVLDAVTSPARPVTISAAKLCGGFQEGVGAGPSNLGHVLASACAKSSSSPALIARTSRAGIPPAGTSCAVGTSSSSG